MSTTRRKAGKQSPPPSATAIERRERELRSQDYDGRRELADMWLARLQRVIVTPRMIENEVGETEEVYKHCLLLERYHSTQAAALHRLLSQVIARKLWEKGEVDADRVRVLNALREFLGYACQRETPFRPGWDDWTRGGAK